jgi:carbamoyltransferase
MLLVAPLRTQHRREALDVRTGLARLEQVRSSVPAITHVDYSARVQTVDRARFPRLHAILEAFQRRTGCPMLINTSMNVRGEPIVNTPTEAYRCFMATELDALVIENFLLLRAAQPAAAALDARGARPSFELD